MSWKVGLSKKIALEYGLYCIVEKDDISFSRKYDLTPRRKMKDDLSQKDYTEIWYLFQMFWKYSLSKKDRAGIWYFLYYLESWYFVPKNMVFFPGWKMRMRWPFSRNTRERIFHLIYSTFPLPKNQRWSYSANIHLLVIDTLDLHPRKSSRNSPYLHGGLYRRFEIFLSSKKSRKLST